MDIENLLQDEASYLRADPWFRAGAQIANAPIAPQTNAQALAIPLLQGLIGGGLQGYGKNRALDAAYGDYRNIVGDAAPEVRPEQWSIKNAQSELISSLLAQEAAESQRMEAAKSQAKMAEQLAKTYGVTPVYSEIGELVGTKPIPGIKVGGNTTGAFSEDSVNAFSKQRDAFYQSDAFKKYAAVEPTARALAAALKDPSTATDFEIPKLLIQIIEPGLAAMQGEVDAVNNSPNIPERLKGEIVKAIQNKTGITLGTRAALERVAMRQYGPRRDAYEKALASFTKTAKLLGAPDELLPEISYLGASAPTEQIFTLGTDFAKELGTITTPLAPRGGYPGPRLIGKDARTGEEIYIVNGVKVKKKGA